MLLVWLRNCPRAASERAGAEETEMRYEVYATAFHGGRLVSRHHTSEAAEKAAKKYRMSGCVCGCAGVIDRGKGEKPGTRADQDRWSDPYTIGME